MNIEINLKRYRRWLYLGTIVLGTSILFYAGLLFNLLPDSTVLNNWYEVLIHIGTFFSATIILIVSWKERILSKRYTMELQELYVKSKIALLQKYPIYSPAAVANVFLALSRNDHYPLTNTKMQKLIYFANGLYLASTGNPLISEAFQAWTNGPVLPNLYSLLRVFRDGPIEIEHIKTIDSIQPDTLAYSIIQSVWEKLKCYSAWQLITLAKEKDAPWDKSLKIAGKFSTISDEDIKNYFSH